jgi:uncharacterized lipoprotein
VKKLIVTALCLLALAACDKPAEEKKPEDKNTPTTTNASATVATPVTAPAAAPVTVADGDLSTPADFEESAEKAITAKTYKADLSALEADVAKE